MDQFKAMQIFKCVAECRSFTQAAEQLDLPKPSVTNAVQNVEQQLGVRLLERTTRKVSLTAEGSLYLERCTRLLSDLRETHALFLGQRPAPSGAVRIDLPDRLARACVIPALPDFFRRYPDIQLRLDSHDGFANLVGEGVDCVVRIGALRDSGQATRRIGSLEQVNCGAKSYLDAHGRPHTPDQLAQHYAVNFFSRESGRDLDWEYVDAEADADGGGAAHARRMRALVSVSSAAAYVASCRAGLGLIQAPRLDLAALLASGELEEVLPRWRPAPLPVSLVSARDQRPSPQARAFVDWLAQLVSRNCGSLSQ